MIRPGTRLQTTLALLSLTAACGLFASPARAHGEDEHCAAVSRSVADAGFGDVVTVECDAGQALVTSDTYPDHVLMNGIVGSNEQVPVPANNYQSPIPLQPELGSDPQTRDAALGVAVNGVPIYDYTGGGEMSLEDLSHHQTRTDTVLTEQLDVCGGHAGRGDDYHYHATPTCMIEQMPNAGPDAIIGWAFDGFPLYGELNPDGSQIAAGTLDVCNGQPDDTYGYRYHTSAGAPYITQCLMGVVPDMGALPRVPPLSPVGGGRGPAAGFPPQGGVDDLVFSEDETGKRIMNYSYQGEDYYISYTPSDTDNCYDFETRTVTNQGALYEQELCRTSGGEPGGAGPEGNVNGQRSDNGADRRPPRGGAGDDTRADVPSERGAGNAPGHERGPSFELASPGIENGGALPLELKCTRAGGKGLSPPLSWSHPPRGTQGYAVVMHHYPRGTYAGIDAPSQYWLLWDIPATVNGIKAGNPDAMGYEGADKDMRRTGYTPPCSPGNQVHTYVITVYAVDGPLDELPTEDDGGVNWTDMMSALRGHVLDASTLTFTN